MPDKLLGYDTATYVLVFLMASWGGLINFLNFLKDEPHPKLLVGLIRFLTDIFTSAFCGFVAFFGCQSLNLPPPTVAAVIGIVGHMGSRGLIIAERILERRLKAWFDLKSNQS